MSSDAYMDGSKPADHEKAITCTEFRLTLKQAFCGCMKKLSFPTNKTCICVSRKKEQQTLNRSRKMCSECARLTRKSFMLQKCANCTNQHRACPYCSGKGVITAVRKLWVPIPAGIRDGQTIILPNRGVSKPGSTAPGDIHIKCNIKPSRPTDNFQLQNGHLCYKKKLHLRDILNGSSFEIEHLDGRILEFPASEDILQPSNIFQVEGEGWPGIDNGSPGTLYVHIDVIYPDTCDTSSLGEFLHEHQDEVFDDDMNSVVQLQEANVWEENPALATKFFQTQR